MLGKFGPFKARPDPDIPESSGSETPSDLTMSESSDEYTSDSLDSNYQTSLFEEEEALPQLLPVTDEDDSDDDFDFDFDDDESEDGAHGK